MKEHMPACTFDLTEMSDRLKKHNQRYLEFLKKSEDSSDFRSIVLATIIDNVADGLVVLDENLTIVMANLAAARLAKWQIEDVDRDELRRNYKLYFDEGRSPVPPEEEPINVALRRKQPYEVELYVTSEHLPNKGLWMRSHAMPLFDGAGKPLGGITIFSDITERVALQRQRDCLAALITHDIKNHLAAEHSFFELIREHGSAPLDEELNKLLADLQSASKRFLGIADSLLEMSRSKFFAGASYPKAIEIAELIEKAIQLSELEAASRGIKVTMECSVGTTMIRVLPSVICHVLHNVIQNAVTVSPDGSVVNVCVTAVSGSVVCTVTDLGPGMSPEEVSQLFSPARVAGHLSKTTHSSGFGLYLSAMLVEEQGGSMTCASALGNGTTITVTLPVADFI